jgi:hypothetical protein
LVLLAVAAAKFLFSDCRLLNFCSPLLLMQISLVMTCNVFWPLL